MILIIGGAHQGKYTYACRQYPDRPIINHYHEMVRTQIQNGEDPLEIAARLIKEKENCVVLSDEIGYGIVPIDGQDRLWREMSGRVNCILAAQAEEVIRVICGIEVKIK